MRADRSTNGVTHGMNELQDLLKAGRSRTLWLSVALAVAIAALLATLFAVLSPAPPRYITMATGLPDGAYQAYAVQYRAILARHGVELRLVPTAGASENLRRLEDPRSGVTVAFVQGGLTTATQSPGLESLGTMFFEPMWIFHTNRGTDTEDPRFFAGRTVSIGPPGSGSNAMARAFAKSMPNVADVHFVELAPSAAKTALERGEIDVMLTVAPWNNPVVLDMLRNPALVVRQFARADAIVALTPYLTKVTVPRGVADLARDLPPADLTLIANKASLIVRKDLHPALQYLLLDAASQVHSAPGIFDAVERFPAAESIDLPLSEQARQYYKSGRPFLQRYLPFWLAVLVERLLYLLIPVVGVIYPLLRLLPNLYGWSMRRRIFRLYGELKFLETDLSRRRDGAPVDDLDERLTDLERRANRLRVPVAFTHLLYTLRMHIGLVRSSLASRSPVRS